MYRVNDTQSIASPCLPASHPATNAVRSRVVVYTHILTCSVSGYGSGRTGVEPAPGFPSFVAGSAMNWPIETGLQLAASTRAIRVH